MNPWINRFAIFAIIFGVWAMAYDTGRTQSQNVCTHSHSQAHR
jgi:hypothetical protein